MPKNIQLIIGSTRQNRSAGDIAPWLQAELSKNTDLNVEIVDLKEQNLPFFESAVPPLYAPDESEAGKAWAEKIAQADGFVFLTAEYNRSIPAALKNALDFLVPEWKEKPAGIVSYGWIDGGQSAATHLKDILNWLKVSVIEPSVAIKFAPELMNEQSRLADPATALSAYSEQIAAMAQDLAK